MSFPKEIIFIKCGGSFITDKQKPYTARPAAIKRIAMQLKQALQQHPDVQFVLGNGAGSYGHYAVLEHNIKNGIQNTDQIYGCACVHDAVSRLHTLVIQECLAQHIPVLSLQPSAMLTTEDGQVKTQSCESFFGFIEQGIIPCVYGDVVYDETKGCHIVSTEMVFEILIHALIQKKYKVRQILYITTVPGVLDEKEDIIPKITPQNYEEIAQMFTQTQGYDVTGGMQHKIERALHFAQKGIDSYVGTITKEQTLSQILARKETTGTWIRK